MAVDIDLIVAMVPRISISFSANIPDHSNHSSTPPSLSPSKMAILPSSTKLSAPSQLIRRRSTSVDRPQQDATKMMKKCDATKASSSSSSNPNPLTSPPNVNPPKPQRRASAIPVRKSSRPSTCRSAAKPAAPKETEKYQRNLRKFHHWCKHCKRVKAAAEQRQERQEPLAGNAFEPIGFASSDLPLKRPSFHLDPNNPISIAMSLKGERPKSAKLPEKSGEEEAGLGTSRAKFSSLFNFDDALSRNPDSVDLNWMTDPWDSDDDDFSYNIDVDTVSVCSESSIIPMPITCESKLKDDDQLFNTRPPLRKSVSAR